MPNFLREVNNRIARPQFLNRPINEFDRIQRNIENGINRAGAWVGSQELKGYYNKKTIQPNFKFFVTFLDRSVLGYNDYELYARVGPMPIIEHWHVTSVTVPSYDFKKEPMMYGPIPRSYPYLEYDGLEVKIEFEEDENGTIGNFINWFVRRVVDRDGTYTPPGKVKIDRLLVETHDNNGVPVGLFTFHGVYLLQASEVEYNYNSNESVKYSCVFNADWVNSYFPKKIVGNAAQKLLGTGVNLASSGIRNIFNNR